MLSRFPPFARRGIRDLKRSGHPMFSVGDSGGRAASSAAAQRRQSGRARREAAIYASIEPRTPRACSMHQPTGPGTDDCYLHAVAFRLLACSSCEQADSLVCVPPPCSRSPIAQLPQRASLVPLTACGKVIRRRQSLELTPSLPFPARLLTACWRFSCSQVAARAPERPLRARPSAGMLGTWGWRVRQPLRRRRRQHGGARRVCERARLRAVERACGAVRARGAGLPRRPRTGSRRPVAAQAVVPGHNGAIGSAIGARYVRYGSRGRLRAHAWKKMYGYRTSTRVQYRARRCSAAVWVSPTDV